MLWNTSTNMKQIKPDRLTRRNLMIPDNLYKELKKLAENSNATMSSIVSEILREKFELKNGGSQS